MTTSADTTPQRDRELNHRLGSEAGGELDREAGFVMVMLALMMVLLLSFAGYSVDAGNWNLHRNEASTTAEAAALGGVAFLPDDFATAELTARAIAMRNGFDAGEIQVNPVIDAPNQLQVVITRDVENYFVRIFGLTTTSIVESSTAEFAQPVEMGSPEIILGNDPETGYEPDYWLSIAGHRALKDLGDQFATSACASGATANCLGTSNQDYDPSGYKYSVRVTDTSQPLRIQVFDPAWTWTGSRCNFPDWVDGAGNPETFFPDASEISALQAAAVSNPQIPNTYYDDAATRYQTGDGAWCTGDDRPGFLDGPSTRFTVRAPDATPWNDNDNPVVSIGGCVPYTFPAYVPNTPYALPTDSIADLLDPNVGTDTQWVVNPSDGVFTFAETFRRWVTLCEIPSSLLTTGDYIIQVQALGGNASGQNRFSLRAGPPSGNTVADVGQSTFSRGQFPIYANSSDADITFYLARVPPSSDERVLRVTFFDVGDASAPGTLTVVPPPDSNYTAFNDCDFERSDGAIIAAGSNCTLNNVLDSNGYGEQIVSATVRVPDDYTCTNSDPDGCWVTVRAQFPGGISDSTTWTAQLVGDAVRLVAE